MWASAVPFPPETPQLLLGSAPLGMGWQMASHFFSPFPEEDLKLRRQNGNTPYISHGKWPPGPNGFHFRIPGFRHHPLPPPTGTVNCPLDSRTKVIIYVSLNLYLHAEFTALNFKWVNQTIRLVYCGCPQTQNYVF